MEQCEDERGEIEPTFTSNVQVLENDSGGNHGKNDLKKKVYGILLIAAILVILLLTLQDANGTVSLSEGLRHWFAKFGIEMTFHSIRSNAHLVLYFVFGIVLCLFGRERGWNWWVVLVVGAGIGLIDEGIKALIPTREFDVIDLLKDWIGVAVALSLMKLKHRKVGK